MCGIAGVVSNEITPQTRQEFHTAFDYLKHRGPHGHNSIELSFPGHPNENLLLGHHRLAIVDLNERANQPQFSKNGSILKR
jgi:asparagine synthetase B (glutamine-hydrolysing)